MATSLRKTICDFIEENNLIENYDEVKLFSRVDIRLNGKPEYKFNPLIFEIYVRNEQFLEYDSLYEFLSQNCDLEEFERLVDHKFKETEWIGENYQIPR